MNFSLSFRESHRGSRSSSSGITETVKAYYAVNTATAVITNCFVVEFSQMNAYTNYLSLLLNTLHCCARINWLFASHYAGSIFISLCGFNRKYP